MEMPSKSEIQFVMIDCWECRQNFNVLEFSKHFETEHIE